METYLIVGLGNPDKKYENTRHNAGFQAIDRLAERLGTSITDKRFKGLFASTIRGGRKLMLLKPLTYMNLSGESVREAFDYYNLETDHVIVMVDDINFACGKMRVRGSGSAGGHNGLKNIILHLGTEEFPRIRIGVGAKDERMDLKDHVLGRFSSEDAPVMSKVFEEAGNAALSIIESGVSETMNKYNGMDLRPKDNI